MSRTIPKGSTSQSVYFEVMDSTSTTGGRKTSLAFNTANLTACYTRNKGLATAITLATLAAADSAYSSGGFKEVDATIQPGVYRLDVPDAALITGVDSVIFTIRGATGMVQASTEVQLSDPFAAAVRAAVGLASANTDTQFAAIQADTDNLQTRIPAALVGGRMDSSVGAAQADTITAASLAADAVAEIQSGLATAAALATVQADTDNMQTRLPAALVGGRMDVSVGAVIGNPVQTNGSGTTNWGGA